MFVSNNNGKASVYIPSVRNFTVYIFICNVHVLVSLLWDGSRDFKNVSIFIKLI